MELLGFLLTLTGFAALFLGLVWLFVRYFKRLQDTADRRSSESPDLGGLGHPGNRPF